MRHLKSGRKLKRTKSHRKATLAALSTSLILHKKIRTTVAKAKEARMVVEKLVTRARNAVAKETSSSVKDVFARRLVFAFLHNRSAVSILFKEIAPKVASRPGGYTRIVKLGRRYGDGAELAVLELVDFNIGQEKTAPKTTKKTSSRKKDIGKTKKGAATQASESAEQKPVEKAHETSAGSSPVSESSGNEIKKG